MSTYQPNVVMLMIGTNDVNGGTDPAEITENLGTIIDRITADSPETHLLVSTITPIDPNVDRGSVELDQRVKDYNALIRTLVPQKAAAGKQVYLVEAGGGLDYGDMLPNDALHPAAAGYDKMGDLWYDFLIPEDAIAAGVSNLVGSQFSDTLTGNGTSNSIQGSGGDDILTGGGGADAFVYTDTDQGVDTITDFGLDDVFQFVAATFGSGLTAGVGLAEGVASATGTFVNGSSLSSQITNSAFLYDGTTGQLSFDADGFGGQDAIAIATLSNRPASLSASQFQIV
jgi:Ca2+-binding RTX toxin-like protein